MVVGRVFRNIACQLGYLDLFNQIPLETTEHDLPLARLKTVHDMGDGSEIGSHCKMDQLLVHKVSVS